MKLRGGFGVVVQTKKLSWAMAALFAFSLAKQANAALVPSADGTVVYDTVNNITWLGNGNLGISNRFGLATCKGAGPQPCVYPSGLMQWSGAVAWVAAMNSANYLGHNTWQLPTSPITDSGCGKVGPQGNSFGFGCTLNALGSLYSGGLGLNAPNTAVAIPSNTVGPFSNFQPYLYWSQSPGTGGNATVSFNSGFEGANTVYNFLYALPMIPGKIAGTPAASGSGLQVNPGGQTVYDPVTNVTWLANANLAAGNTFGISHCTSATNPAVCVNQDGSMTLAAANQLIANMNAAAYLGQTTWELPPIAGSCTGFACSSASDPMAELYSGQLGLSQGTPVVAAPNTNVGPFNNIQPYLYWSCQAATIQSPCGSAVPAANFEWTFSFGNGFLGTDLVGNEFYVLPYFVGAPSNLCTYSLNAGGQTFTAAGGNGSITITTGANCSWSVSGLPTWVTLTSPSSGMGPATVTFEISPDTGSDLSATLSIGGANYTLQLQSASIPSGGFSGSMPHLAAGGTWETTFMLVNTGSSASQARLSFFADAGGALQLPVTFPQNSSAPGPTLGSSFDFSLGPNALQIADTRPPDSQPVVVGSAQIQQTGGTGGFAIFKYNFTKQEAVVPLQTSVAASYLLAFDNTNGVATGVAVENASVAAANVAVTIRDDGGAILGNTSLGLAANGHTSFVLATQYPATANKRGTIQFTPPGGAAQISALGIRFTPPGTLTTIPVLANVTGAPTSVAHIASGGGWMTTVVLVNTGSSAATATLKFFDDNGNALPLPLTFTQTGATLTASQVNQSIAANASLIMQSNAATTQPEVGSMQLTSNGNIGGYVIFRYTPNGQEASTPFEGAPWTAYVIPFDHTSQIVTGLAVNNASPQAATIPVILRSDTGAQIGTASLGLNANGHTSFLLATQYPETAGIRGTVELDTPAGAQINVLGIRTPPTLTFTTLPAVTR